MQSRNPVVKRQGIPAEENRRRSLVTQTWGRHRELQAFLGDHFPNEWRDIQRCGLRFKTYESRDRPGYYKLLPYSCHHVPLCINCTRMEAVRRVHSTLDNFNRCTPKGKQPVFVHIVQTAPIYADGGGWGNEASRDIPKFSKLVWQTLVEHYGEGIGCVMSYQDFGERCFAKRHPHLDLTLNGWSLTDGKPTRTPTIDLTGKGRKHWDDAITARATRFRVDAQRGNPDFTPPIEGNRAYYRVLKYQMRELVELRKLGYSRSQGKVWWMSYKENRREPFTTQDFLAGLTEYQTRLGAWVKGAPSLHRAFGHLAKRSITKTQAAMEGAPIPHGTGCPCSQCGDWDRVFLDEVEESFVSR